MLPTPELVSLTEGSEWQEFAGNKDRVHAIMFSDGSVLDVVNGWRKPNEWDWTCTADEMRQLIAGTLPNVSMSHWGMHSGAQAGLR